MDGCSGLIQVRVENAVKPAYVCSENKWQHGYHDHACRQTDHHLRRGDSRRRRWKCQVWEHQLWAKDLQHKLTVDDWQASTMHQQSPPMTDQNLHYQQHTKQYKKVAHTRLPSVWFRSWSRFLAVSLQVTWVINPAVGCHYFPPGPQLSSQPLRRLLPVSQLGEQRHDGCEQFA